MKLKYTDDMLYNSKFFHLSFVSIVERKKDKLICKWKCDCGNDALGDLYVVKAGRKKTCGCYMTMKKENNPMWSGYGEIPGDYFNRLKFGAKTRKIELKVGKKYLWNLFLKQDRKCNLTGDVLTFDTRHGRFDGTASLDRIDSNLPYIEGNVQWVHKDVNTMKWDLSQERLLELCEKIYRHKQLMVP